MDSQNSVVEGRFDSRLVESLWKLERPREAAIRSLDDVVAGVFAFLPLDLLLATNRQDAVVCSDLDLFRVESRGLDVETELVLVLLDVDGGGPHGAAVTASERVLEEPVNFAAEPENGRCGAGSVKHLGYLSFV